MKFIFRLWMIVFLAGGITAGRDVDRIYDYITDGRIAEARKALQELPQTPIRDGNRLFVSALLEPDGQRSYELLEAALRSDLDGKYEEEARLRMIRYSEAAEERTAVVSSGVSFLKRWEMSDYRRQVLAILAHASPDNGDEQRRYLDLLIETFPGTYYGQCAHLIKADAAFDRGHYKTATTYCRRINNAPGEDLTPASLVLLSRIALQRDESERALLNYNILREQYPHAIGQDLLLAGLKQVSEEKSGEESTEVFEGISYSVQVGVFSQKDNAEGMSDRIEGYGYGARIVRREISGNRYYVVLGGRFKTMKEAQAARQKLEIGEGDIFKVVVNDEK